MDIEVCINSLFISEKLLLRQITPENSYKAFYKTHVASTYIVAMWISLQTNLLISLTIERSICRNPYEPYDSGESLTCGPYISLVIFTSHILVYLSEHLNIHIGFSMNIRPLTIISRPHCNFHILTYARSISLDINKYLTADLRYRLYI